MLKIILHFIISVILIVTVFGKSFAFHSGGVGACEGCHTMHNTTGRAGLGVSPWLLKGPDPSSICLNCHAGPGAASSSNIASPDGSAMTPGGDFYWLKKTFIWVGGSSPGERHGHNIIAMDYGFLHDITHAQSPGGSYNSSVLGCNSCHDPHGKTNKGLPVSDSGSYGGTPAKGTTLGNYRLLGGLSYKGGKQTVGYSFNYNTPVAKQNPGIKYGQSDTSHVDYGSGMSEWCGNCHEAYLNNEHNKSGGSGFGHPAGNARRLEQKMISNYNTYIKTGDFSGNAATAYLALVPFERGIKDVNFLNPTSTQGPYASSNVMCLTCHRAHASAFKNIGRWDFGASLIVNSHPAAGDAGVTGNDVFYSYYGRNITAQFGSGQRQFCEKCHGSSIPQ